MTKAKKCYYQTRFPAVTKSDMEQMHGKHRAENYCIFLHDSTSTLFIRCFHRYYNGAIAEVQRYVFAEDGCVRYGLGQDGKTWTERKEFREPVFTLGGNPYMTYRDNSYTVIGYDRLRYTWLKYACAKEYPGANLLEYFRFYKKHYNAEYLLKSGYSGLVKDAVDQRCFVDIDWKENNLLKMLRLNRTEFAMLKGQENRYREYMEYRKIFPDCKPEELLQFEEFFGYKFGILDRVLRNSGLHIRKLYRYLKSHDVEINDYCDYLTECQKLKYDLSDDAIRCPKHFTEAHARTTSRIQWQHDAKTLKAFRKAMPERKKLEFASGELLIRQPRSMDEIIAEGRMLHHCVGGYAERHARGELHILFIRKQAEPDVPYYTMELSTGGDVVQVRGLKNCYPSASVAEFVERYKNYIAPQNNKKARTYA